MSSFEQRFTIRELVFPFLSGPALMRLCHVHRDFRSYLMFFVPKMRMMITIKNPSKRLKFAAKTGSRALCELAREWILNVDKATQLSNWNLMLGTAAKNGHRELCELVRSWSQIPEGAITHGAKDADRKTTRQKQPSLDWYGMLYNAAKRGHRELCELARAWGADWDGAIHVAARGGYRNICEMAYEWSHEKPVGRASNWNRMLWQAAMGGHRDLCKLACEWCLATGQKIIWNQMLFGAAYGGHRELCILACEWAHDADVGWLMDWDNMLNHAAAGGHRELCELARERGATDWDGMLGSAVRHGHRDICILAREWGATHLDDMFYAASLYGYRDLCELAREWSRKVPGYYPDWNIILGGAASGGHRKICILAREWALADKQKLNLSEMLHFATHYQHPRVIELARSWIAEREAKDTLDSH